MFGSTVLQLPRVRETLLLEVVAEPRVGPHCGVVAAPRVAIQYVPVLVTYCNRYPLTVQQIVILYAQVFQSRVISHPPHHPAVCDVTS
jgi:hypothetical protein